MYVIPNRTHHMVCTVSLMVMHQRAQPRDNNEIANVKCLLILALITKAEYRLHNLCIMYISIGYRLAWLCSHFTPFLHTPTILFPHKLPLIWILNWSLDSIKLCRPESLSKSFAKFDYPSMNRTSNEPFRKTKQ